MNQIFTKRINLRFIFLCAAVSVVSLYSLSLPLLKDFHYEYSAVHSFILTILISFYTVSSFRRESEIEFGKKIVLLFKESMTLTAIPLIVQLAVFFISHPLCWELGIPYYLLYVVPAPVIGMGLAFSSLLMSKRTPRLILAIIIILVCILPVIDLYLHCNVFFFNPLIVYYPGTIYDERIMVDSRQIWYRLCTILFFSMPILYAGNINFKRFAPKNVFISFLASLSALFFFLSPQLGFSTGAQALNKMLPDVIVTPHFRIHTSEHQFTSNEKYFAAFLHETYYQQLKVFYHDSTEIIDSYIFPNDETKYQLTGAGEAEIAKPWTNQIFLTLHTYRHSLKHELAHIFSGRFGYSPFKLSHLFNPVLLEGSAVSTSLLYDVFDLYYMADNALARQNKVHIAESFAPKSFFFNSPSLSYTVSGAFCRYLIETYGIDKFKLSYKNGISAGIYGKSIDELEQDFLEFLKSRNYPTNPALTQYYFGRKSIFARMSPRAIAYKTEEADELIRFGKYREAVACIQQLRTMTNNPELLFLEITAYAKLGKIKTALDTLEIFIKDHQDNAALLRAELLCGDIAALARDTGRAKAYFQKVIDSKVHNRLDIIAQYKMLIVNTVSDSAYFTAQFDSIKFNILLKTQARQPDNGYLTGLVSLFRITKCNYVSAKAVINNNLGNLLGQLNVISLIDAAWYASENGDYPCADKILELAQKHCYEDQALYVSETASTIHELRIIDSRYRSFIKW